MSVKSRVFISTICALYHFSPFFKAFSMVPITTLANRDFYRKKANKHRKLSIKLVFFVFARPFKPLVLTRSLSAFKIRILRDFLIILVPNMMCLLLKLAMLCPFPQKVFFPQFFGFYRLTSIINHLLTSAEPPVLIRSQRKLSRSLDLDFLIILVPNMTCLLIKLAILCPFPQKVSALSITDQISITHH